MTDTDPYVPDLEHIRSAYVDGRRDDMVLPQDAEAEFDRWKATHAVIDLSRVDVNALAEVAHEDQDLLFAIRRDTMRKAVLRVLYRLGLEAK
jgi:hypothetical protein